MADQEAEEELDEQEQLERDELDREIRINKALQTMEKELHVSQAVVKLVLLKLLKTHCGNWKHIEDEGYRLLSNVIFEEEEAEAEKAPGSSSGRKPAGKEKNKRATPRKAPRNSKRAESDDSDEHDHSLELIRRGKRVPVDSSTHAASVERGAVARRGRASTTRRTVAAADDDDDPAWEPRLALPSPASRIAPPQQCQEPQNRAGRRRISTGVQCVDK